MYHPSNTWGPAAAAISSTRASTTSSTGPTGGRRGEGGIQSEVERLVRAQWGKKTRRRRRRRRRREVHTHTHTHPHPHTPTHPHTQAHEKSPFLPLFAGDGRHLQAVTRRSAEIVCTFPRCTGVPTDPVSQWRRCVCRRVWSAHIFLNLRLQSLTNTQAAPLEMTPGCHDGLHPHLSPCMPAPTHELRVHTTL